MNRGFKRTRENIIRYFTSSRDSTPLPQSCTTMSTNWCQSIWKSDYRNNAHRHVTSNTSSVHVAWKQIIRCGNMWIALRKDWSDGNTSIDKSIQSSYSRSKSWCVRCTRFPLGDRVDIGAGFLGVFFRFCVCPASGWRTSSGCSRPSARS